MPDEDSATLKEARELLRSLPTPQLRDPAAADFHDRVLSLAERDPGVLARAATAALRDDDQRVRVAAVSALGRCAETGPDSLAAEVEGALFLLAERDQERPVASAVAVALNHLWNRLDDPPWAMQLRCALSPYAALRLAAAQAFASSTTVPLPELLVPAAERLASDRDAEVRRLAQDALRHREERPAE